jgi:hypothetical protein
LAIFCEDSDTTPEHIHPLTLGGHDQLVIPVDVDLNRRLGSWKTPGR